MFSCMFKQVRKVLVSVVLMLSVIAPVSASSKLSGAAPDFTLKSRGGSNVRLAELRGQVVLVNFWASWCGPCREEMPKLEDLHNTYKDLGFSLLGINLDQTPELSKKLLKNIKVTFPVLYDPENKISEAYNVEAMPSTFLIDRNGNWRMLHKGYESGYEDEYAEQIKQLLREWSEIENEKKAAIDGVNDDDPITGMFID